MHKVLFGGLLLAMAASTASAEFTAATLQLPGNAPQQSFANLQAIARGNGEQVTRNALPIPYNSSMSATGGGIGDYARAYARESYSFSGSTLQLDLTNFERTGPSMLSSDGHWVFTVSAPTLTVASGFMALVNESGPSGNGQTFGLRASLQDLTAGITLFESSQTTVAAQGMFVLGGLAGQQSKFSGSLTNLLEPLHAYLFSYGFFVERTGSNADSSMSTGQVMLSAVPEPAGMLLTLSGLVAVVGYATSRRRVTSR